MWQPFLCLHLNTDLTTTFTARAYACSTNLPPEPLLLARAARHVLCRAILCACVLGCRCSRRSFYMPLR